MALRLTVQENGRSTQVIVRLPDVIDAEPGEAYLRARLEADRGEPIEVAIRSKICNFSLCPGS